MLELPIDSFLPDIIEKLRAHPSLIIVAPPGAGKTTRVPPAILHANLLTSENPNLIMLQPRRVAARASAARIAEENAWQLGQQVGYHIRFEKRYAPTTRIRVLTEAILTRMLLHDPYLETIGCVILDEFHERNLHTDLAVAFLREIQQTVRPDLKIVVMSATLDAAPVAQFLGDAPVVTAHGRAWPVEITYRPARDRRLEDHVAAVVDEALSSSDDDGDILVFLPGIGEIERARRALASAERDGIAVLPLHGSLSPEEQQFALRPDPAHRQKVILATNIAETSLTIDGVRTVIDSGLARVASFDVDRGMDRLDLQRIAQASTTQRAGRAGRQAPGRAFRLWPESDQKHLAPFSVPEIHRIDLAATVLAIHAWGAKDARRFGWFDPPAEERLRPAEALLDMLGALKEGAITDSGRRMVGLPVHPRIARLLLAASSTPWMDQAVNLAAMLSDDSRAARDRQGNPLDSVDRVPPHLQRVREQIAAIARSLPANTQNLPIENLAELLLLAYPDRIARRRASDPHAAVMVSGIGLRLEPNALTPAIAAHPLFLALETHHDPRNQRAEVAVCTACPVEEFWLERLFPEKLRDETMLTFDPERNKVVAVSRRYFADLVLHEDPHGQVDATHAGRIMAAALAPQARELFLKEEAAAAVMARVALIRQSIPEAALNWPPFDEAQLRQLLADACTGKKSLAELTTGGALIQALRSALPYPLDRELDRLAPDAIQVPSGSKIRLQYPAPSGGSVPPPILAVRLQELFGWIDTPRICAGRVPVLLHLLSPGFKPMQITTDLRSFWSSAYFAVRKDLRVRYPKHKWPEDPLTAQPEAKGRPRQR